MLDDKSPMPFGKYRGTAMINVDAEYLLFLYDQNISKKTWGSMSDVMVYINDNLEALKKEK
jgi:uncharacterized protein (DUF3820 family)